MKFIRQNWLYALIALLPFERIPSLDVSIAGRPVTLRLSYILAGAIVLFALPKLITKLRFSIKSPQTWLIAYLFVSGLSVLASTEPKEGVIALVATSLTILTAITISYSLKQFDADRIYNVLFAATAVVCAVGLYQFIGDSLGLSTAWTGLREHYTRAVFGFPRIQSTALEPLYLGNFLLIPFMLVVGRIYTGRATRRDYPFLLLLLVTMILTLSRGTFGSAVAGLGVLGLVLLSQTNLKRMAMLAGIGALSVGLSFGAVTIASKKDTASNKPPVQTFVNQSTTVSTNPGRPDGDRGITRYLAKEGFKEQPILGHGLSSFNAYASRSGEIAISDAVVNNQYLETLFETGALGAFALIGFLTTLAIAGWKAWRRSTKYRLWIGCLAAAVVGFMVQYYSFSTIYIMHIWVTIGLLLGFIELSRNRQYEA